MLLPSRLLSGAPVPDTGPGAVECQSQMLSMALTLGCLAPSWGGDGGGRVTIAGRPPQPGVGLGVFSTASERALRINGNENEGGRADPTPRSHVRPPAASPGEDASARLVPGQAAAGGNARPGRRGR